MTHALYKFQFLIVIEEGGSTVPEVYDLKSFSDVPTARWSHDAIMEIVDLGMFTSAKAPDANSVGAFDPTGTMTREQGAMVAYRFVNAKSAPAVQPGTEPVVQPDSNGIVYDGRMMIQLPDGSTMFLPVD